MHTGTHYFQITNKKKEKKRSNYGLACSKTGFNTWMPKCLVKEKPGCIEKIDV